MASKNVWGPSDKETEIKYLVQKLTSTGKKTLDDIEMKKLKSICKLSDKYVNCTYYALMTQLRKDHAEIRYSALLIINELFVRSSVFRAKLEFDFEEFLELVEGTNPEKPLPLPVSVAKDLKLKGLEFVKNWATKFGEKYIRLQLAVNYLKKCRKVDFNDMEARNVAERERHQQEQERLERVNNQKISKVKEEMQEMSEEMCNVVNQMENCFKLLIPSSSQHLFTAEDFVPGQSENEGVTKDQAEIASDASSSMSESSSISHTECLRHHGITDMKKNLVIEVQNNSGLTVDISDDTSPVIDNLKDLEKQITSRFYPAVTRWLKILSKGTNCSDTVKKAIDLKQLLESSLEKYKDLQLKPSKVNEDSDEDDDFEEVGEKEGYEEKVQTPQSLRPKGLREPQPSTSKAGDPFLWKLEPKDDVDDPTSAASTLKKRFQNIQPMSSSTVLEMPVSVSKIKVEKNSSKAELLEKAPVLPYDIDLYHWEEEKPIVPERIKFDSLHKFWESKDDSDECEALKEEQVASLRTRKIDFSGKFEPVKWTCRAPLASGKLCPRRDRYKCPFHGKVIPRDVMGNPSDGAGIMAEPMKQEPSTSGTPDWQDPSLLKDIQAATGIDLKIPDKKSKKGSRKKTDGLTDLKQIKNTTRNRLTKKIIKRYRHYAKKLDEVERKRFNDKFGDQWNYY